MPFRSSTFGPATCQGLCDRGCRAGSMEGRTCAVLHESQLAEQMLEDKKSVITDSVLVNT